MTAPEWMRPADACALFGVSRSKLERWARAGRIRRSRPDGGACWLKASDIADMIAASATERTVVPITAAPAPADDWESLPFWSKAR